MVTGPTASGKTALAIDLARELGTDVVSADSRQIFRDIPVGTAAPSPDEMRGVTHHFVGILPLDRYYSAAAYEADVMSLLPRLFASHGGRAVMCGGSMMYVDAVVNGIDDLPVVSDEVRAHVLEVYRSGGLDAIRAMLRTMDPAYLDTADPANHRRLVHAVEISLEAGVPYSSLRTGIRKSRPFNVVKIMIDWPRPILFDRINRRVDAMMEHGFLDEARRVYPLRHLNSLNTVGFKEMFAYIDGKMSLDEAVSRMAKNTRVYAKKQLTWLRRDPAVIRLDPARPLLPQALDAVEHRSTGR